MSHELLGAYTSHSVPHGTSGTSTNFTSHTVQTGTHLLCCCIAGEGGENLSPTTPIQWDGNQLTQALSGDTGAESNSDVRCYLYGLLNPTPGTGDARITWQFTAAPWQLLWFNVSFSTGLPATLAEAFEYLQADVNTTPNGVTEFPVSGDDGQSPFIFAAAQQIGMGPADINIGDYTIEDRGTTGPASSDFAWIIARGGTFNQNFEDATTEAVTIGWQGTDQNTGFKFQFLNAASGEPVITDVNVNEIIKHGEDAIITGSEFGSVTGTVIISPTDDSADVGAVAQTVTAWANTEITFTGARGALNLDDTYYLFVTDDSANVNASGYEVSFGPNAELVYTVDIGLQFAAEFSFVGFSSVVSDFETRAVTEYNSIVGYSPIVVMEDSDMVVGGFGSTNSLNSFQQRRKKRIKELQRLLQELYDLSPDP